MRIVYLVLILLVAIFLGFIWTIADDQAQSMAQITTPTKWQLSHPTSSPAIGPYSFQPGPNVRFRNYDGAILEVTALIDDQSVRWMTQSDEGALPTGTQPLHVTIGLKAGSEESEPFRYVVPPFAPLRLDHQTPQDSLLIYPGTKDYRGLPLRMTCHLGARERKALADFEIVRGMQQGQCSFMGFGRPDILVQIQPIPLGRLGESHLLLPAFFVLISDSLIRTK
jgi:hypothetical protein